MLIHANKRAWLVWLGDDGTLDTVVQYEDSVTHRRFACTVDQETAAEYRDEDGLMGEKQLERLFLDVVIDDYDAEVADGLIERCLEQRLTVDIFRAIDRVIESTHKTGTIGCDIEEMHTYLYVTGELFEESRR